MKKTVLFALPLVALILAMACKKQEAVQIEAPAATEQVAAPVAAPTATPVPVAIDPVVDQAIVAAQKLQGCPPYNGNGIWSNHIQFTIGGEPVKDLANSAIQSMFTAKSIVTVPADIDKVCSFIGQVAKTPKKFNGKSIDLTEILARMNKKP